ncbi:N-acetyltransferase [Vibrio sinensis]|uniref:N-acetyltransferase n=1 Tax=Vibrio sinensis TaxID=2302434 RepID=A0A3A6QXR1_9VIBR|nr:GNAT family N-acetyltransferase [Vibrio sinensis]RJX67540.1 N-acetyltransferase [Vibrio sinensis]
MTIVTRRLLLVPYNYSLQSEFLMLNCCVKNRAEMNGPHTVSSAKQLFQHVLSDESLHARAVLDSYNREYIGHLFISDLYGEPELGFIFDKAYWGKGIALEALSAFVPKAMRERKLTSIKSAVNRHHIAASRVLEKMGFEFVCEKHDALGSYKEYQFTSDVVEDETSQYETLAW